MPDSPRDGRLDGDGVPEIVDRAASAAALHGLRRATASRSARRFVNQQRQVRRQVERAATTPSSPRRHPGVGDLDDDGVPDLIEGARRHATSLLAFATGGKRHDFEHHVAAWDTKTGNFKTGFPQIIEDWQFFRTRRSPTSTATARPR